MKCRDLLSFCCRSWGYRVREIAPLLKRNWETWRRHRKSWRSSGRRRRRRSAWALVVNLLILNLPAESESPVNFTLQGKARILGNTDIPSRCVCMHRKSLDMMRIGTHPVGVWILLAHSLSSLWLSKDLFLQSLIIVLYLRTWFVTSKL